MGVKQKRWDELQSWGVSELIERIIELEEILEKKATKGKVTN